MSVITSFCSLIKPAEGAGVPRGLMKDAPPINAPGTTNVNG
jgi:hypothetical protein